MSPVTHAYIGDIVKFDKTPDGDLLVYGKAAGPDLDLDGERCDPKWLRKAVPDWFEWGNVREQHSNRAAGVGIEIDNKGDDWYIKALVTDPTTAHKVETGTLKGWSLGAIGVRSYTDNRGQKWLTDGEIVEFSLVDRPCNPTTTLDIATKSAGGGGEWEPVPVAGEVIAKAVKLDHERDVAGSQKAADPDEKAPAFDRGVALAVATAVHRHDRDGAQQLALKAIAADGLQDEVPDIAGGRAVIAQLAKLICAEAEELAAGYLDESYDIQLLLQAVNNVKWWLGKEEAAEAGDSELDGMDSAMVFVGFGAEGVTFKYVSAAKRREYADAGIAMPNGDFPIPDEGHLKSAVGHWEGYTGDKAAAKRHIIKRAKALGLTNLLPDDWTGGDGSKFVEPEEVPPVQVEKSAEADVTKVSAAGLDADAVQKIVDAAVMKALAPQQAENASLREELAQIKSTAIPGGPFVVAPPSAGPTAEDTAKQAAAGYRAIASKASDPSVREAYRALAAQTEAEARR